MGPHSEGCPKPLPGAHQSSRPIEDWAEVVPVLAYPSPAALHPGRLRVLGVVVYQLADALLADAQQLRHFGHPQLFLVQEARQPGGSCRVAGLCPSRA